MAGNETLENVNPTVHERLVERKTTAEDEDDDIEDLFDTREIFDLVRNINDPEHPLTLEELHVVENAEIEVNNQDNIIKVNFTPTIPHCSMATLIGLSIRVKLQRALPPRFKVDVCIKEGTHVSEKAVNKQLADKERIAAALENNNLLEVVNQCLSGRDA
ncbi:MIP18 family protein galla-2-like isoform X2 [Apostichopus japonicus]|uniref:MIP18 family protein galla-2-like isoform X2 n=1 Tax=Stichopus japonicus TaxID=307972 RepID=UPI003AB7E532